MYCIFHTVHCVVNYLHTQPHYIHIWAYPFTGLDYWTILLDCTIGLKKLLFFVFLHFITKLNLETDTIYHETQLVATLITKTALKP